MITYRAVRRWQDGAISGWAVEVIVPGKHPELHGAFRSEEDAQAEIDRLLLTGQGDGRNRRPPKEIGGPKGPEPTRYGDWEVNGRCSDF